MKKQIEYHHLNTHNCNLLIDATVFDNAADPHQLNQFVNSPGHEMIFATIGERVIGMASGSVLLHPDKEPAFFINEVGVDETMRNQGIGAELAQGLLKLARDKGHKGVWLATEQENKPARALYRKLDGRETTGIVVYDWDGAMDE